MGYMTPIGCLETARVQVSKHKQSSLTILILENETFGMIEYGAKYVYDVPDIIPTLKFDSCSTEKLSRVQGVANAFGFNTYKVSAANDLGAVLKSFLTTHGLHMVE